MERVRIETEKPYDVLIGPGLLKKAGEEIARVVRPCRAAVITDDTVRILYGETVVESLQKAGFQAEIWAFPHGERQKTMATLAQALEWHWVLVGGVRVYEDGSWYLRLADGWHRKADIFWKWNEGSRFILAREVYIHRIGT